MRLVARIIVLRALIAGDIPNFNIEYILRGRVVLPTPEVKKAMMKSSKLKVNARSMPENNGA